MARHCEVREMRNAEAGLVIIRATRGGGHWKAA
jgi:alpha-D-ribose 1-methylphosphonate 5-triphosphate synthase subunit PhnG